MKELETRYSIVIPTFNSRSWIGETVESALGQKNLKVEIVIDDNASSDGTPEVLKTRFGNSLLLRIIENKEDLNIPNGWNRAIANAKGDYRLLLHSDNLLHPNFLEVIDYFVEKYRPQAIYSDCIYFLNESNTFEWTALPAWGNIPFSLVSPGSESAFYVFSHQRMIPTSCLFFQSELLGKRSPYSPNYRWDPDIEWMNWLCLNASILHIRVPLVAIRTHEGQVSSWKHKEFSNQYQRLLQLTHRNAKTSEEHYLTQWAGSNYDVLSKISKVKTDASLYFFYWFRWLGAETKLSFLFCKERWSHLKRMMRLAGNWARVHFKKKESSANRKRDLLIPDSMGIPTSSKAL